MSRSTFRHAWSIALTAAALVVLLAPATVLAHAELDTSAPADGETVTGSPPTIEATYTETLDPDGSSLVLVDATGADIATGGVATTEPTKEMSITELPELAPGEYTVKSTTKSADDGDVDRTTWSFTVVAAPTPSPKPAPTPAGAPSPSTAPTPSPSAIAPSPSLATPTPSADTGDAAGNSSDALLPIIAGLAIVVVAAVLLLRRRGRTSPPA